MSQFMVYRNSNPNSSKAYPYLLDDQSNLLESLDTRLVIPLSPKSLFHDFGLFKHASSNSGFRLVRLLVH